MEGENVAKTFKTSRQHDKNAQVIAGKQFFLCKDWNASFAKQIKLNCEIISFLQGWRLFWAYENIPSCLLNFYMMGPFFLCKIFVLLSICYIFSQNMSNVFKYANANEIKHKLRIHICAKFRKSFHLQSPFI